MRITPTSVRKDVGRNRIVFFWGLRDNIRALFVCVVTRLYFGTDEWANFIIIDLPLENEIYTFFGKTWVSRT